MKGTALSTTRHSFRIALTATGESPTQEESLMAKNDRRNSNKMKRRRGQASKRRTEARRKTAMTEARKSGTKVKKLRPLPPPPKVEAPVPSPAPVVTTL